jgi:hypothetical protein
MVPLAHGTGTKCRVCHPNRYHCDVDEGLRVQKTAVSPCGAHGALDFDSHSSRDAIDAPQDVTEDHEVDSSNAERDMAVVTTLIRAGPGNGPALLFFH